MNENLLESYLSRSEPEYFLYEPERVQIVLGAGGEVERDVLLDQARQEGVPILRRRGGGGTVVLSPGQVVLALVTEVGKPFNNMEYARSINAWFREALEALGVEGIEDRGISDLAIRERKILGTTLYRRRLILFYQASLLVENDISLFRRYLTFPDRVPDYRRRRDHEEFCTTLCREGYRLSTMQVMGALKPVVERNLPGFG